MRGRSSSIPPTSRGPAVRARHFAPQNPGYAFGHKPLTGIAIIRVFNGYLISLAKRIWRKKEIVVKGCLRIIWGVDGMADMCGLEPHASQHKGSSPLLPTNRNEAQEQHSDANGSGLGRKLNSLRALAQQVRAPL